MLNVKTNKSTSLPEGGNVEESCVITPPTYLLAATEITVAETSNNQTISEPDSNNKLSRTELCADGGDFKAQQDGLDKTNGRLLNSSSQVDPNVSEEVTNTCFNETVSPKDRERIIKELGISSTSFIGPLCRPGPSFEDELSEFYKELEEVDNSDRVDGKASSGQGHHLSCKSEGDKPHKKENPAVLADQRAACRPYPEPYERSGRHWKSRDPKRWRTHVQHDMSGFGRGGRFENWHPPPPWIHQGPPNSRFENFFSPPAGSLMYPHHHNHANDWPQWEGPRLPPNDWHGYDRRYNPDQQYHHSEDQYHYNNAALVLILLRGVPGSGKTTLAKELLSTGPSGIILSTDDYFFQDNRYVFDPALLGEAHEWNQRKAERAMTEGCTPVIIDNTNVKAWEMKPYVKMALENRYRVDFLEPDTFWKCDPVELEKRNKHGVPRESIAKMLDRFERPISVAIVMNSVEPPHKSRGH